MKNTILTLILILLLGGIAYSAKLLDDREVANVRLEQIIIDVQKKIINYKYLCLDEEGNVLKANQSIGQITHLETKILTDDQIKKLKEVLEEKAITDAVRLEKAGI